MRESTPSPLILPQQLAGLPAPAAEASKPQPDWLLAVAPLSCTAVWVAATSASFLFWMITGSQGPLNWCRSGGGLIGAGALAGVTLLVATVRLRAQTGRVRVIRRSPSEPAASAALPGGWRFEEGGFTPV
jgi:hypothetical protein